MDPREYRLHWLRAELRPILYDTSRKLGVAQGKIAGTVQGLAVLD
jgi:hypothetical protein